MVGDEKAEKMLDRAITAQKNAEDTLAKEKEGVRAALERFDKQCEEKPSHQTGTLPIAGIVGVFGTAVSTALLIELRQSFKTDTRTKQGTTARNIMHNA